MKDLNSVNLTGNLIKDSTFKDFGNGSGVLEFTIATNRSVKKGDKWGEEASFINIKYISKGAAKLSQYCVKGTKVAVNGSLVQESWEKDGKKNSAMKVYADDIYLLGGKKEGSSNGSEASSPNLEFEDDCPF